MKTLLSPARIRAGERMLAYYSEAAAHVLAEEEAADALLVPTGADLVAARVADLLATPDARARYAAYLDGLELTHGTDQAMRVVIAEGRARLAVYGDDPEHPDLAPDGDPVPVPDGPDHTPPADAEVAA